MKTIEEMREYFIAEKHKYLNMNLVINRVYISRDLIVVINMSLMNECAVSYEDMTFGGVKVIEVTGDNYFEVGIRRASIKKTILVTTPCGNDSAMQSFMNHFIKDKEGK